MAIILPNTPVIQPLVYDRLFMDKMIIHQTRVPVTAQPKYDIKLNLTKYAVDAENNRHYSLEKEYIFLGDILKRAMAEDPNNPTLMNALYAIQTAVAKAYFEKTGQEVTIV